MGGITRGDRSELAVPGLGRVDAVFRVRDHYDRDRDRDRDGDRDGDRDVGVSLSS